ncbi:Phospholipid methyltransferase [Drechmeria coniospora]|uniref:Phosphatidyl-N-methylethanolamine N-methyltransferase n=1 Tax=Drechmeria coniospora TaxID=98403 RepID=A0A151GD03_DRECN|nr:Phospholipid methyltransferase [Drechmeria coniospora]KYK54953.1 Phospholipid methyltransferase [Drechmeria coniospora]
MDVLMSRFVDFGKTSLLQYRTKILTKLFGGHSRRACYALAATIFTLGILRDYLFKMAIQEQPSHPLLLGFVSKAAAWALLAAGNVMVGTSMWLLGITGTYLGDYFGILMDDMVTGFPFNVCRAPMYWGATTCFLGMALLYGKPAGLLLSGWVMLVYVVALRFEDPFTAEIYAKRERERAEGRKGE